MRIRFAVFDWIRIRFACPIEFRVTPLRGISTPALVSYVGPGIPPAKAAWIGRGCPLAKDFTLRPNTQVRIFRIASMA